MSKRGWRALTTAAAVAVVTIAPLLFVAVSAEPAGAVIVGPCTGTGSLQKGTKAKGPFTVDSTKLAPGTVIVVPIKDVVHWQGTITGVSGRRAISGFVAVKLPAPIGNITVDSWGKTTVRTENSGVHAYSVPSSLPRGVVIRVDGSHSENGAVVCTGYVDVKLEGSAFDTPWTIAALVLTFGAAVVFILAGRPVFKKLRAESDATP